MGQWESERGREGERDSSSAQRVPKIPSGAVHGNLKSRVGTGLAGTAKRDELADTTTFVRDVESTHRAQRDRPAHRRTGRPVPHADFVAPAVLPDDDG